MALSSKTPNEPIGGDTMSPAMGQARNYYRWIASQFLPVLGRRVLDVGGGRGVHLAHVVSDDRFVMSIDVCGRCVREMEKRFGGPRFAALRGDIVQPALVQRLMAERFDTVVCVNVLEHIARDAAALKSMARILSPSGGFLFLLVPAHPVLFGTPDELAGHFRRYRRRELSDLVRRCGFRDVQARYFNRLGAIPYFLNSRVLRPTSLGGSIDTQILVFDKYFVPVLRRIDPWVPLPFGQSVIVTARGERH